MAKFTIMLKFILLKILIWLMLFVIWLMFVSCIFMDIYFYAGFSPYFFCFYDGDNAV